MDRIEIKGYKSIKELDLKLNPINILIGANGSGKSNFLSFFEFLRNLYIQNLRKYVALQGGTDRVLHKGSKITTEISAKLHFDNKTNKYSFTIQNGDGGFIFTKEGLWYTGYSPQYDFYDIASMSYEANVKDANGFRAHYIREYLEGLVKYHFHDTSANSPFTKASNINNDKYKLYSKGDNIAAFLYNMKVETPLYYNFIIKTIQSIAPYFNDFVLIPNEAGFVLLQWTSKDSETIYGVSDLSDGTIRFIALCTLFLQPKPPATIIIDEPELGLHPKAITKLAGMIKSVSKRDCQVIVATQSADLIKYFEPKDIIAVDLENGESRFERLNEEQLQIWLDEYYTIDELWRQNIISHAQPKFD